jgi:hypothetical protein
LVGWSHHRAEHPLPSGEHQADGHHGQQEEDQAQERGEEATSAPPLFVLLHALGEELGARDVQSEVRLGAAARLQKDPDSIKTENKINSQSTFTKHFTTRRYYWLSTRRNYISVHHLKHVVLACVQMKKICNSPLA